MKPEIKIPQCGFGFDSHAFSSQGTLVFGGLRFPGVPALAGHSDGDALLHALIDALLGAAGLGDIGELFPDSNKKIKGISSLIMLKQVMKKIKQAGFAPYHIDITVVAQKPRLSSVKKKLSQLISKVLSVSITHVNIKGKTPEGLTWFVPQGGIAVWAVATVISQ